MIICPDIPEDHSSDQVLFPGVGGRHSVTAESEGYRHLSPGHQLRPGPRLSLRLPDDAALHGPPGDGGQDLPAELYLRPLHSQHLQRHLVIRSDRRLYLDQNIPNSFEIELVTRPILGAEGNKTPFVLGGKRRIFNMRGLQ